MSNGDGNDGARGTVERGRAFAAATVLAEGGAAAPTSSARPASDGEGPAEGPPLLEVRGLEKRFGGLRAVDGVSFALRPGQTVSVIGPNGSGKTTLFNLIGGQLRPDAGDVRLEGVAIAGRAPERIAELGVARTFQNGRVFGNMSVEENVLLGRFTRLRAARPWAGLRHRPLLRWLPLLAETALALGRPPALRREEGEAEAEATRQLGRFGERLLPRRGAPAYSLSYANRRRTEIARALAARPRLLLLDEPTAGMNPTETAEVLDQIAALRAQGQAILLIEHKLDLVMALSDRVIVLDHGQVIAAGPPAAIQADPRVIEAYLGRRVVGGGVVGGGGAAARDRDQRDAVAAPVGRGEASSPVSLPTTPPPHHPTTSSPLLRLEGIDAFYGSAQALAGVSLEVGAAEIVCLLGGNASGKSTTMKVILGLLAPRSGRVVLDGEEVTGRSTAERVRRGIASVPEARRLFPEMTVEENLRMGAYLRRDERAIGDDLDRMYGLFPRLGERRRQLAGTMSGGEQQMVAMARALMSRPRLICMDEPTMGLAPVVVDLVLETIATVNRQGVAVFMVEQNAALALGLADRGYVVQNGRLVLSGAAADLLADPAVQAAYLGQRVAD